MTDAPGANELSLDPTGLADPGSSSSEVDADARATAPSTDPPTTSTWTLDRIGDAFDGIEALDRVGDPIWRVIDGHLPQRLRAVLQGRWLGHPLHPVMTDLPIGSWTSAWVLDVLGGRRAEPSADALVAIGVFTAIPTAWTGWSEWITLPDERRRSGLVHAASNGVAIALYTSSLVARRRGSRSLGRRLGHAGAAVATFGGLLGGHLAFGGD